MITRERIRILESTLRILAICLIVESNCSFASYLIMQFAKFGQAQYKTINKNILKEKSKNVISVPELLLLLLQKMNYPDHVVMAIER
jgi:hypothetical protein